MNAAGVLRSADSRAARCPMPDKDEFHFRTVRRSPAKLNLTLKVGDRDAKTDLHRIHSRAVLTDFCETLAFNIELLPSRPDEFAFRILPTEQCCPRDADNLMSKAARMWTQARGVGAKITILHDDNVPTGRGFGIASSNAIEMLRALESGWRTLHPSSPSAADPFSPNVREAAVPDANRMRFICSRLGSDCSFFAYGGSEAIISGCGEKIERIANPPARRFLIAIPPATQSTASAFASLYANGTKTLDSFEDTSGMKEIRRFIENHTGIRGMWRLTGSGSAHFIEDPPPKVVKKCKNLMSDGCPIRFVEAKRSACLEIFAELPSTRLELA